MEVKRDRHGVVTSRLFPLAVVALSLAAGLPTAAGEEKPGGKRQGEILTAIARHAPWEPPERWLHELGSAPERNPILRERMLLSPSWIEFLSFANALDWCDADRAATVAFLLARLPALRSGKVRQNAIFLIALTDPDARRTLGSLAGDQSGQTGEDLADCRSALAALGDPAAAEWFLNQFPPTRAFVGRPVFTYADYVTEELGEGNRSTVRSYRLWEVLFREPYFKRLKLLARAGIYSMNARAASTAERRSLAAKLLPAFIAKWPGHPGSDDFAFRLMNHAIEGKDRREIYLWAERASLLPDQDCAPDATRILTALAESQLSVADVDGVLAAEGGKQNGDFLRYERFLKTARGDIAAGIGYFDGLAATDRGGFFALARQQAAAVEPSPALRDGIRDDLTVEIIRLYPERSRELAATPHEAAARAGEDDFLHVLNDREREVVRRTRIGRRQSVALDPGRVARQYRLLVEVRNLEGLERAESDPEIQAELRYRRAKVFYREPDVLFPAWGEHTLGWGYALNAVRYDAESDRRLEEYAAAAFALRRAYTALESILKDYPDYRGRHSVAFHMAQSYAKLMDYKPAKAVDAWVWPDRPPPASEEGAEEYAHRRIGELFRRVADEFPESEWAEEAERGAAYRFKMAGLLRAKREKERKEKPPPGESRSF